MGWLDLVDPGGVFHDSSAEKWVGEQTVKGTQCDDGKCKK